MEIVIGLVALVIGGFVGLTVGTRRGADREQTLTAAKLGSAKDEAERIRKEATADADAARKAAELEAKERVLEQQQAFEAEAKSTRQELADTERRLRSREEKLDKRAEGLDGREAELKSLEREANDKMKAAANLESELETRSESIDEKLAEIAGLSPDAARRQILERAESEARLEVGKMIKAIEDEAKEEAEKRAKKIISVAIQRYSGEYVTERCVTTVPLPSDDLKGRIIGREGRNIRALEAATGVDLIIDDTPEAVVVSAFDPVRRQIGSLTLRRLIADGRIHPGRVEEVAAKVKREIDQIIKESGEQAAFELGIHGLHPQILKQIGRLRYRTSYGQNMWSHAIEVGWLCGMMAAELGLNIKKARRAGLLHDIGKAMDHDQEGSHAIIGADFCKKHGESELVVNAIAAHHNEVPAESVIAHLVMSADALSGARPGARREILQTYVKRLEDIERISRSFDGVDKCYAIQAGREVRIMVDHTRINDDEATILSRDIARKIEQELTYPGQIRVCVIRETRASEVAR